MGKQVISLELDCSMRTCADAHRAVQPKSSQTEVNMMNHTIYILAGVVLVTGILAFWFFSGLGFLFFLVFLRSNGRVLDLYRITRLEQRPAEPNKMGRIVTGPSLQSGQISHLLSEANPESDQQTSNYDNLALSLAASFDQGISSRGE
jgi:hypothetical protein